MQMAVGILLNQMPATVGIKKHEERAMAVLFQEFKQLNDGAIEGKPVIAPVDPKTLSIKEMRNALNVVTVIKEKKMVH